MGTSHWSLVVPNKTGVNTFGVYTGNQGTSVSVIDLDIGALRPHEKSRVVLVPDSRYGSLDGRKPPLGFLTSQLSHVGLGTVDGRVRDLQRGSLFFSYFRQTSCISINRSPCGYSLKWNTLIYLGH